MSVTPFRKKIKTPEEDFNLADVLSSAAAPKDIKSKSTVPVLTVSKEIQEKAAKLRQVKEEIESLESTYELLSAEIIEKVSPLRETLCRQGYVSSVRVPDGKGLSIGLSWADKYSEIATDNEAALKEIAGKMFEEYFTSNMIITVKDMSEESLKEIVKAIGPSRFAQIFEVKRSFKPNSRFNQEQFAAFTSEQRQKLAQSGVKQNKPSIKVK